MTETKGRSGRLGMEMKACSAVGDTHGMKRALCSINTTSEGFLSLLMVCLGTISVCVRAHKIGRVYSSLLGSSSLPHKIAIAPLGPTSSHFLPQDLTSCMSKQSTAVTEHLLPLRLGVEVFNQCECGEVIHRK